MIDEYSKPLSGDVQRDTRRTWTTWRPMVLSILGILILIGGIGVWAFRVNISGAVIGSGLIEVAENITTVQHPVGGVVSEILAKDGDAVEAGDVVIRLDDRQILSDLNVVEADLFETLANIDRYDALMADARTISFHPLLHENAIKDPWIGILMERQQRQLDEQYETFDRERGLLDQQVRQVKAEISGVRAQLAAKNDEIAVLAQELEAIESLTGRGLAKKSELFDLRKKDVAARGDLGRLSASIAELGGKVTELELEQLAVVPKAREKAADELSKLRPFRTKHLERRLSLLNNLSKMEIRAPVSGRIHQSKVEGLRSVVVKAKPIMEIVPNSEPAVVSVKIDVSDIDQVYNGQDASLKFRAFNGREIPIILGRVLQISADAILNPTTRKYYYDVKVELLEDEMQKLGEKNLIPGMPVEAFLSTESRTPINYVLRPIMTYFDRAFRDA